MNSFIDVGISDVLVSARSSLIMEFPSGSHSSPQEDDDDEHGFSHSSPHVSYVKKQNALISSGVNSLQRPLARMRRRKAVAHKALLLFILSFLFVFVS